MLDFNYDLEKIAKKLKPKKPIFKEPIYKLSKCYYYIQFFGIIGNMN